MSHSPKTAFCPLYFSAHGGQFGPKGVPLFNGEIPGLCDRAFDCGTCSLVSKWLGEMGDWQIGWECDACLKTTFLMDKSQGMHRLLPGLYQSSQPDEQEHGYLNGCTRCGWHTSFLQLILRRQHG